MSVGDFFKTRYRVVSDKYCGFEAQYRHWWMPFYLQCFGTNTSSTLEGAKFVINGHKRQVLYSE